VQADDVELRGHAGLSASTYGSGDAGEVHVEVSGRLALFGNSEGRSTFISTQGLGAATHGGEARVDASEIKIRNSARIGRAIFGTGEAGTTTILADRLLISGDSARRFTRINSRVSQRATGKGGRTIIDASGKLEIRNYGELASGTFGGSAGNVHLRAGTLVVDHAGIRTAGTGSDGGRIQIEASNLIHLRDAEVTSNGIGPRPGSSVITLRAPLMALNDSQVTSLTGTGEPLASSGLAQLFGGTTVISADSVVAASSSLTVIGLENEVGSRLVVPRSLFLDAGDLMRESCAARGMAGLSSFTAVGRGGLPPDPAQPLPAAYAPPAHDTTARQAGPVPAAARSRCTSAQTRAPSGTS
jgi:hypothetical protein